MNIRSNKKQWLLIALGILATLAGEGYVIISGLAWYWAVAVFIFAFACFSYLGAKQEKQHIEAHFGGRPTLGDKEFGEHYFSPDRAEVAAKLRKILANHAGIDLSRMNPTDRLIEDLLMDDFDSMSTVEFVIEIEREFDIEIPNEKAEKMTTFQSVVDYVAEAVKFKAN
ncbi:MAG TPA: acyl carrier protein [Verrucomicrobiae bacterium]|jgi:acyl carrier protein